MYIIMSGEDPEHYRDKNIRRLCEKETNVGENRDHCPLSFIK